MRRLYVFRHGIAVDHGTPGYEEDERPLTPKGERRVREITRGLRRMDLAIDGILTSPLPRALRTAQIAAGMLGLEDLLEAVDALRPERSAASIRDWVTARPEDSVMIVGHNPALGELIGLMMGAGSARIELRKGGLACLSRGVEGEFALDWMARPRLIRRLVE